MEKAEFKAGGGAYKQRKDGKEHVRKEKKSQENVEYLGS